VRALCFALLALTASPLAAAPLDDVLADPARSSDDVARDARDHPKEVLQFFGIEPDMVVLDLWAGSGYWSEIIGRIVGPTGKVYLHNNATYLGLAGKALDARVASGRLPANVVRLDRELGHLGLPPASVDVVLMSMTYHDLYFKSDDWSMDPAAVFAEIHALLKPNGVLAVIDHAALPGTGANAAQPLHRIDEAFAQQDIASRGFRFDGALDVLRRADDDHALSVFDSKVRGKTDRFVHRYIRVATP
jgi:predicted methyltransferase